MADSEGDNYNEVNRSNAARTDSIGDIELITTEGTPGWMEKVLRIGNWIFAISRSSTLEQHPEKSHFAEPANNGAAVTQTHNSIFQNYF